MAPSKSGAVIGEQPEDVPRNQAIQSILDIEGSGLARTIPYALFSYIQRALIREAQKKSPHLNKNWTLFPK